MILFQLFRALPPVISFPIWFAICPILTVGNIQTTDLLLLHHSSPCHLLLALVLSVRGQC